MASGDNLADLLDEARLEMPDVDASVWVRLGRFAARRRGGSWLYVKSGAKHRHLEALAAAGATADVEKLAKLLGITPRRVRQLRQLQDERD